MLKPPIKYMNVRRAEFSQGKTTPLCGDVVTISVNDGAENTIDEIHPRKNQLMRPPVANIDSLIIVASTVKPRPSTLVIDKLTAVAEHKNIEPVIIVTRMIWRLPMSLCQFISMRALSLLPFQTKQARESVKSENCFAENKRFYREFGSRKTSLLNRIAPELKLATSAISEKLGRGRHTTREAELFRRQADI